MSAKITKSNILKMNKTIDIQTVIDNDKLPDMFKIDGGDISNYVVEEFKKLGYKESTSLGIFHGQLICCFNKNDEKFYYRFNDKTLYQHVINLPILEISGLYMFLKKDIPRNLIAEEYNWYKENKSNLLTKFKDKYIVIKDNKVIGSYNTEANAYIESVENSHKVGTFLIQKVSVDDASITLL